MIKEIVGYFNVNTRRVGVSLGRFEQSGHCIGKVDVLLAAFANFIHFRGLSFSS